MWWLLALTVPVFYIIGLVTVIRSFTSKKGSAGQIDSRVVDGLQVLIDRNDMVNRAQLEELRDWATGVTGHGPVLSSDAETVVASDLSHPGVNLAVPPNGTNRAQPPVLRKPIDNVNLLLFLGAFLLVVSAGIFVGVNYQDLTGSVKTVLLAIFALVFYGAGMVLFRLSAKYRPAAITFLGIGLIVIPLVGLAAYNMVYGQTNGGAVWFVTSVVTLAFYIATLLMTRLTFVAYFMAAMVLSLFESTTWLAGLPVYWLSWGMTLTAILLAFAARRKLLWDEAAESLAISGQVFLPIALLLSLGFISEYGLGQVGLTFVLGALFYAFMATARPKLDYTDAYLALAYGLLSFGVVLGLWDTLDRIWLGLVVVFIAIFYHLLARYGTHVFSRQEREITALAAGLTALGAAAILAERPGSLVIGLLIAVVISIDLAFILRQSVVAALGIFAALCLPMALASALGYDTETVANFVVYAGLYAALVPALFYLRLRMTGWPESGAAVGQLGYLVAAVLALGNAAYADPWQGIIFGLIVAAVLYGLSYYETGEWLGIVAGGALYVGLWQIARLESVAPWTSSAVMAVAAAGLAFLGHAQPAGFRSRNFRWVAIGGATLGALAGSNLSPAQLAPIGSLFLMAVLVWLEGQRLRLPMIKEVGGGIGTLAVMWFWGYLGYTNLQVYTWTLGAFGAWMTQRYWSSENSRDLWLAGTMAVITIPLAGQALSENGQLYGLALIVTAIAIVFIGMSLRSRLAIIWGAATLMAEVLYQMRDLLFAIPKYLISAGLGIALITAAIVALKRRSND